MCRMQHNSHLTDCDPDQKKFLGAQCRAQEMIVQLDLSNEASVNEFMNVLKSDGSHREGDVVPSPPQSEAGNYKSEAALQI